MKSPEEKAPPTRAPRGGLQLMVLILVVLTAVAVYSNLQKARRGHLETVTIVPAASPTPSPIPAAP